MPTSSPTPALIRWYIILNPAAGRGRAGKMRTRIEQSLRETGIEYELGITTRTWHAAELVRTAIEAGFRHIAAVGGDGTAFEVVNGIFSQTAVPTTDITYAAIPIGTGNDWVRTHKIPNNIEAAIQLLVTPRTILHDVGVVRYTSSPTLLEDAPPRYFINVTGLAYDSLITRLANAVPNRLRSRTLFQLLIVANIFGYRAPQLRIELHDGTVLNEAFYNVSIGVCSYNGGGCCLLPQADPTAGQLAMTVIRALPVWQIVTNLHKLYDGSIATLSYATLYTTTAVTVTGNTDVEADGELLGVAPVHISLLPQALRVVSLWEDAV